MTKYRQKIGSKDTITPKILIKDFTTVDRNEKLMFIDKDK